MKVKILLLFIALTFVSGTTDVLGQKKKDPRLQSGKNLHNTLLTMLRQAKENTDKKYECDQRGLLNSIPRKKLVPSAEELKKEIGYIVDDSLQPPFWADEYTFGKALNVLSETKTKKEFLQGIAGYDANRWLNRADFDKYYYSFRKAQKSGFVIQKRSFKQKECNVTVETIMKPLKFRWGTPDIKNTRITMITWEITTLISVDCPCTKNNKFKVKSAKYKYSGEVEGPLMFDLPLRSYRGSRVIKYGLRFPKVKDPKLAYTYLECCKNPQDPVEDGSFIDPNENINDKNTLLDTGLGVGFGSELETNIGFSGGVLFNVTQIGGNPLFVGPKATVSTTSITSEDIKELKVLIGPTVEYQIPLNSGNVNIITGVNSGYVFGNVDAFGFEQDISGFAVNTYAGAQIAVGSNVALTAVLNFFEFNSLTFKSDMENFESTTSNTTFLTDGGAINVGVRIGLD